MRRSRSSPAPDRVFISTDGTDAAMLQLAAGADGQLTARELWRTNRMNNKFTSPVLHDGFIYGLDESILACIDASTGELKWKGGRYGYGQVMLASGHLIVLTEEGELALVRADPTGASGDHAVPRHRRQDVEPPGDERRHPAHPQHRGNGGVRFT